MAQLNFNIPGGKFHVRPEEVDSLIKNMTSYLDKVSDQDSAKLELVRHHEAIYQVSTGIVYTVFAEIKENGIAKNCSLSLHEKPWLEYAKFDVDCPNKKYQWLSEGAKREKRSVGDSTPLLGGEIEMPSNELGEIHNKLVESFDQLAAQKPEAQFQVRRIVSGKKQVVAGMRYDMKVEVLNTKTGETKVCNCEIWEKLWEEFRQVDLDCPNQPKIYRVTKEKQQTV